MIHGAAGGNALGTKSDAHEQRRKHRACALRGKRAATSKQCRTQPTLLLLSTRKGMGSDFAGGAPAITDAAGCWSSKIFAGTRLVLLSSALPFSPLKTSATLGGGSTEASSTSLVTSDSFGSIKTGGAMLLLAVTIPLPPLLPPPLLPLPPLLSPPPLVLPPPPPLELCGLWLSCVGMFLRKSGSMSAATSILPMITRATVQTSCPPPPPPPVK